MYQLKKENLICIIKNRKLLKEVYMEKVSAPLEQKNYNYYVKHKNKELYMKIKIWEILKESFLLIFNN